jgi:hypothetical protein
MGPGSHVGFPISAKNKNLVLKRGAVVVVIVIAW